MVTRLTKQGARRYRSFGATLALVSALPSVGLSSAPPASVVRRRYPQFHQAAASPWLVKTLDSLGSPAAPSGGSSTGTYSRARAVNNTMEPLKQSTARNLMVFLVDSADHVTGKTGLTLTITASKDGGAFGSISPTVTERGNGWYNVALTGTHTDTLGDLALHITATNADPCDLKLPVEVDRTGATVSSVTGNVGGSVGSIAGVTFPTNFSALSIDANGRVKAQTGIRKNTALAGFMFLMTDSTAHNPKTGASVTGTVSLDGGAFNSLTNAVTEVSGGFYKVNLAAADVNGDVVALRFTASGADDTDISFTTSA